MTEEFRKEISQRIIKNVLDIQILRLIKAQPMWGYMIKKQVQTKFDLKLRHGTLYPLLNSLEERSFITSQKEQQAGRTRKIYTLTHKGEEYLHAYNAVLKEQFENEYFEESLQF